MNTPAMLPPAPAISNRKLVVFILLGVGFFFAALTGGIILLVFSLMRSNGAFTGAMERARAHPEVLRALGEPIHDGYFITGSINVSGDSGSARITIPLNGPKASGSLHVVADLKSDVWHFQELRLNSGTPAEVNLLSQSGVVKSFDKEKGFGYLTTGDGAKDIFVERSDILLYGEPSLEPGQSVEFETTQTAKGIKAIRVKVK